MTIEKKKYMFYLCRLNGLMRNTDVKQRITKCLENSKCEKHNQEKAVIFTKSKIVVVHKSERGRYFWRNHIEAEKEWSRTQGRSERAMVGTRQGSEEQNPRDVIKNEIAVTWGCVNG